MPASASGRGLLFSLILLFAFPLRANDVDQSLKQTYHSKIFVLRHFWHGKSLVYDSIGNVMGSTSLGSWATDGIVRVDKIVTSPSGLMLECRRLVVGSDGSGKLDYNDSQRKVSLEVELDPKQMTADLVDRVLNRIFLTSNDRFIDGVPEYWKPCALEALTKSQESTRTGCAFSRRLVSVLGGVDSRDHSPRDYTSGAAGGLAVVKLGPGLTKPRIIYSPNPPSTEEAREAGRFAVAALSLIIDPRGRPQDIRIVRPVGYGLDENAVATVTNWRFEPARKDGEPVAVAVVVEVVFR